MISFTDVAKTYHIHKFQHTVFRNVSFEIAEGTTLGICGANGAGKSTLLRLIAGVEPPTAGDVRRTGTCSWPIGYTSCFQHSLTGADNSRFIARIYNRDEQELLDYVENFAQLGPYFRQPLATYSAGMLARLAFGVSLAIEFDIYLVDEVTGAGDDRFRERCHDALVHRGTNGTLLMTSHSPETLRMYTTKGAVLFGGCLTFYDTIDEALEVHGRNQAGG